MSVRARVGSTALVCVASRCSCECSKTLVRHSPCGSDPRSSAAPSSSGCPAPPGCSQTALPNRAGSAALPQHDRVSVATGWSLCSAAHCPSVGWLAGVAPDSPLVPPLLTRHSAPHTPLAAYYRRRKDLAIPSYPGRWERQIRLRGEVLEVMLRSHASVGDGCRRAFDWD